MSDIDLKLDSDETTDVLRAHASVVREAPKLATGKHPISLLGLLLCGLVAIAAGGYLGQLTETGFGLGNIDPFVLAATDPRPGAGDVVELPLFEQLMAEGARNYASCVGCHSADGSGQAATGIPPLAGSEWVTDSDERLALILLHGVGGPIQVAGKTYNNPAMQVSIAAGMTDRQIAAIMTYIRNSWGNSASMVTAEGVADARQRHAGRSSFWTAEELLAEVPDGDRLPGAPEAEGEGAEGAEEAGEQGAGDEAVPGDGGGSGGEQAAGHGDPAPGLAGPGGTGRGGVEFVAGVSYVEGDGDGVGAIEPGRRVSGARLQTSDSQLPYTLGELPGWWAI